MEFTDDTEKVEARNELYEELDVEVICVIFVMKGKSQKRWRKFFSVLISLIFT